MHQSALLGSGSVVHMQPQLNMVKDNLCVGVARGRRGHLDTFDGPTGRRVSELSSVVHERAVKTSFVVTIFIQVTLFTCSQTQTQTTLATHESCRPQLFCPASRRRN